MSLYVLPLVVVAMLLALLARLGLGLWRMLRRTLVIARAEFRVEPLIVRPGEGIRLWARVEGRGGQPVHVQATLTCTMFDHRAKKLYGHAASLTPVIGRPGEHAAFLTMPSYALRTGVVGDELSSLFSEDAHRLLVFWSIEFEVRRSAASAPVLRESIPIDVPDGKKLEPDRAYVERLIVDTCAAMHSDLVLNWLVRMAAADGQIVPRERELLHTVLREVHRVPTAEAADARIAVEMNRDLSLDPEVLKKHIPAETLLSFYRFLYAMAWRDGQLDGREHDFLVEVLERFGLDAPMVRAVEREVLYGMAQHAIR